MDLVNAVIAWFADPTHWSGANGVPYRLAQHVGISAASLAIAAAIALPVGLYIGHTGRGQALAINPTQLEGVWNTLKPLMHPDEAGRASPLDAKTREIIALAVSATNGCHY